MGAMFCCFLEILGYFGFFLIGEPFDRTFIQELKEPSLAGGSAISQTVSQAVVVHPFQGTVYSADPLRKTDEAERYPITKYGFSDKAEPFFHKRPDQLILAVMGGSVAGIFGKEGVETLEGELKKSPPFSKKKFIFVNLGIGGYKQPQQLMTLTYLLVQGAEFDIVLNIDGFNEVALYPAENRASGIYPWFPRRWHVKVQEMKDPNAMRNLLEVVLWEERKKAWAAIFEKAPIKYSVSANFVWRVFDRRMNLYLERAQELAKSSQSELRYQAVGPGADFKDDDSMYRELTNIWRRSSVELFKLCRAHGIAYYHFLQPNQYAPPYKPMSEREHKIAYGNSGYGQFAEAGYPYLKNAGQELKAEGIHYFDLTGVFKNVETPLYIDNCCHFNRLGNEIMAKEIAHSLLEEGGKTPLS